MAFSAYRPKKTNSADIQKLFFITQQDRGNFDRDQGPKVLLARDILLIASIGSIDRQWLWSR